MADLSNLTHEFKSQDIIKGITMKVTIKESKFYSFRIWLGFILIKLGVLITGMGFETNFGIKE